MGIVRTWNKARHKDRRYLSDYDRSHTFSQRGERGVLLQVGPRMPKNQRLIEVRFPSRKQPSGWRVIIMRVAWNWSLWYQDRKTEAQT